MAESAVFSLACKILSTIASPTFDKAYERGLSIWEAKKELSKLKVTIETIQAVLLDAEKKQESSATAKNLIKRLKAVLYDADDLIDEVAINDLFKQQMVARNHDHFLKNKVRFFCSKLNPIVSRNSLAKKLKAIRMSLLGISTDIARFEFVIRQHEEPIFGMGGGQDQGSFVDSSEVIGRDADKKAILEMLFDVSINARPDFPTTIAIVGIGGMGKTTLVQLIYNDDEVKRNFEKRWFACISDTFDEKEVIGKIFKSISGENYSNFDVGQLQTKIRESIGDKKILLVLDDVWDEDRARWQKRMSLLGGVAKGSKIIVTTRSPLVAKGVGSSKTHNLVGLSEDESWSLFKRVAFTPEQGKDPRWTDLGREVVKKCRNVPLVIKSIGSLLFEKNTMQEWESFKDEELSKLKVHGSDSIMNTLKLSYEHLPSSLKHCFAYCSLFPKDFEFDVQKLIYLWIAQGYIKPNNEMQRIEEAGESCFMYLLRRGFFQEAKVDRFGEIKSCKMHDLIHDVALYVAGDESIMLTTTSSHLSNCTRHVSIGGIKIDESWAIPASLLNVKKLRSCFLVCHNSVCSATSVDQVFANFKLLRALYLSRLGIKDISHSIGELKHLRSLDLSWNEFETLPDSMMNLVNLITLDVRRCRKLKALPDNLGALINLRCLNISRCVELKHMPRGIEEISCLQYLSDFKVGKAPREVSQKRSGLDVLARLQHQLRGELSIHFQDGMEEEEAWDGDECTWQLPVSPQQLEIWRYPGRSIADWGTNGSANNLASLNLRRCKHIKYLPPLRRLPNLKYLTLWNLAELEYIEEEEDGSIHNNGSKSFFPRLEVLIMFYLPELKGWWRKVASTSRPQFPLLAYIRLQDCPKVELESLPIPPCLHLQKPDFYTAAHS